ncbi:MAG: four helix bundle protein [Deltaproteobacteria bacterium]|nr:four helix bundle protein [Deltaproteobacteria bacterium]
MKLKVWQKAYHLCLEIYKVSRRFPKEERFASTSMMRQATVENKPLNP